MGPVEVTAGKTKWSSERERERETRGGAPVELREKEGLVRPASKHANATEKNEWSSG